MRHTQHNQHMNTSLKSSLKTLNIYIKLNETSMEKSALFHSPVSELGNAVVIVVSSVFLSNGYSAY